MFGTNGNTVVDIGIAMTLQDRFTRPANEILTSWRGLMGDMNTYSQGMKLAYQNSLDQGIGLMKSMASTFAYSAEVQKNTFLTNKMINDGTDHQAEMLREAQAINLRNPLTALDITSGQKFMAMAGMSAQHIKEAAEPAAQMAAIFDMQMGGKGGTADLLTNIMATFQIEANKATDAADQLAVATTSANMSLPDLAQSIKYVGANAKMAGMDVGDIAAAIGVLGNYGIQGSMAGTNLGQALNALNKAVTGASQNGVKALKALGLSPDDLKTAEGNLIPVHDMVVKIAKAMEGKGGVERQSIMFGLFGQRGLRAMNPLIEDVRNGINKYDEIRKKIEGSSGWLSKTTEEYMESPQGKIRQLTSAWENLRVTAGAALSSTFVPLIRMIVPVINAFNTFAGTGMGKFVINAFAAVTAFTTIRTLISYGSTMMTALATSTSAAATGSSVLGNGMRGAAASSGVMLNNLRMSYMLMAQMSIMQQGGGRIVPFAGSKVSVGMYQGAPTFFRRGKAGKGWTQVRPEVADRYLNRYFAYAGPGGGPAPKPNPAPLLGPMTRMFGNTAGRAITTGVGVLGRGLGSIAGFLTGPWGLAIMAGMSFLPMIVNLLSGKKEPSQEELEAKQKAEDDKIWKALREGKSATINLNVNGRPVGTFGDGDTATIEDPNQTAIDYGIY